MKYKIYQMKHDERLHFARFQSYEAAVNRIPELSLTDYTLVYSGEILLENSDDISVLNKLFEIFNINRPEDFKGHSLSVSDVIELESGYYYINEISFKKLEKF